MYRNYDNLIIKVLFNTKGRLNGRRTDKILANKYPNILSYLNNRYKDSTCLRETLLRIYFHIEERPVCLNCGKPVEFIGKKKKMYASFCCCKCNSIYHDLGKKWQQTQINYNLKHYGVKYNFQVESVKKKRTQTLIEKYGVEQPLLIPKSKEKYYNTCLKRYGFTSPLKNPKIMDKVWGTMKKNHSFNRSIPEDKCYEMLIDKFTKNDVIRQYKSDLYPWHADFYIKSIDTYIECNFHWTHGEHPFNKNDKNDLEIVNEWKSKNTEYFNNAINTWCNLDVNKRKMAKQNNLNYLEFYYIEELEEWISQIKK